MTQEERSRAFAGRWRIKREANKEVLEAIGEYCESVIRDMCRDFFEAGYYLSDGIPMSAIVKAAEEVAFDEWWELYNKKRGKEKCMKKWLKLTANEKQACIDATPAYVESTPDVIYRKDPLTYLNGKCWNDEIYFRKDTRKQQQQRLTEAATRIAEYTKDD